MYLVKNVAGREFRIKKSEYENLAKNGVRLTIIDEIKEQVKEEKDEKLDVPHAPIGVYLQRLTTGERNCASDRIRGEWIIKNSDKFEIYRKGIDYDVVIFHKPIPEISTVKGIKILDLCDSVWKSTPNFLKLIETVDAIVVSTEGLKKELSKITDKDIHVIGDGHDMEYYETKVFNRHFRKAQEAVWFGYAQNAGCLSPFMRTLKENGIKLKAISQCQLPPLDSSDEFIKWDVDTCIEEISKADFAILPFNGELKSNNKDVTAYLSGIPVAKNSSDIVNLINPRNRRIAVKKFKENIEQYDVKNNISEYLKLIDKLRGVEVYTSICGGYEEERNDITAINEDKFVDPVMNAKIPKVLSHKYFDSKYTIWVDGNISLNVEPSEIIDLLGDSDIAVFKHPHRNCIYQEHPHARDRLPKEQHHLIDKQIEDYRKEGMPSDFGLAECGMIIRRNNSAVEEFNNRWWAEITRYQRRDQISFPYVLWKMKDKIKVKFLEGNVRNHKCFTYVSHKRS